MVSRREFIKLAALTAAVSAGVKLRGDSIAEALAETTTDVRFVPNICALCPAACNIQVEIRDGKVHRIHGTPDHPINNGKICARGNAGVQRVYNPDRLKKPLIRTGEKGKWAFREASWEEAISLIAKKIREYHDLGHPEYIGVIGGWLPCGFYQPFFKAFLGALGTPNGTGVPPAVCFLAKKFGWATAYGVGEHPEILTDYEKARYVIFLRRNVGGSISIVHGWRLGQSKKNFKMVVLDPRYSETVAKADLWLPIKPGTDLAFLLAMMNVIINEKLYDKEFIARYSNAPMLLKDGAPYKVWDEEGKKKYLVYDLAKQEAIKHEDALLPALEGEFEIEGDKVIPVFEAIKRRVMQYTPEWAEKITDIDAEKIREVAREFALRRGVIDTGWHDPKYLNSVLTWRAVALLNALVGSVNRDGGIILTGLAQFVSANEPPPEAPPQSVLRMWAEKRGIALAHIGHTVQGFYDAIVNEDPYPIKMMFIFGHNMLTNLPERTKWEEALRKLEFTVAVDILPQDHLYYADVVLPESTYIEKDDPIFPIPYVPAFGFQTRVKAIEPLYDTKHVIDMMVEITRAIGKEETFFKILGKVLDVDGKKMMEYYHSEGVAGIRRAQAEAKGIDYNELVSKGSVITVGRDGIVGTMPYTKPLPTPTGKVEFFSFALASLAKKVKNPYWDALIKWVPPRISERELANNEMYLVYSRSPFTTHCSTSDNPLLAKLIEDSEIFYKGVWINSEKAKELGIKNGDRIVLESVYTGEKTESIAFVTELVREDTLFMVSGFGQQSKKLTSAPKELHALMSVVPLQYDPLSGATMNQEAIVRVWRML
ncbi:MAG: molybdopterin-dependent oxidoreductase [Archaeoglobus sp.]|nr:molybdopterin-dependent oxidoreductase [Archaeoglobus sp.]